MKVLIAFECSQIIMSEFLKKGHDAYSCDLQESYGEFPERHLKMNFTDAIKLEKWDFVGIHPECTALTLSGNRHYSYGKLKYNDRLKSIDETIGFWDLLVKNSKAGYMENPVGALNNSNYLPKPQIIQPYWFGDPVAKKTCLWLHNLPDLIATLYCTPETIIYNSKKTKTGQSKYSVFWKLSSSKNEKNRMLRSQSFPGVAKAMANQWTEIIIL